MKNGFTSDSRNWGRVKKKGSKKKKRIRNCYTNFAWIYFDECMMDLITYFGLFTANDRYILLLIAIIK